MRQHLLAIAAASLVVLGCADTDTTLAPPPQADKGGNKLDDYAIIDLGTFGAGYAQAFGINDAGVIAGRYGSPSRSFAWTEHAGMSDLGDVEPGRPFQYLRMNNRGQMTGWFAPSALPNSPTRAVLRERDGTFVYLIDASYYSQAGGINNDGVVVGSRRLLSPANSLFEAFIRSPDGSIEIIPPWPTPLRPQAQANDINDHGQVVGTTSHKDPTKPYVETRAFIWSAANGMQLLPSLGGVSSAVTQINDNGVVVGAGQTQVPVPVNNPCATYVLNFSPLSCVPGHAWRWSQERGLEDLGTLGGTHSVAWALDNDGNAYGWAEDAGGRKHAVKWTWTQPIQTIKLGDLGGNQSQAGGVNARGTIAAQAGDAFGTQHAVLYVRNGQQNMPNIVRGDSVLLVSVRDPETDLIVIEGLPYPLNTYSVCGGTAGAELVPLKQSGEISGVIKSLTNEKDVGYYVWKLSEFHGYCHTPPLAYGRGRFMYNDNDTYMTSNHPDTWGFRMQADVTILATGEQKSLFAVTRVSMSGTEFTNHVTHVDLR